jgi:hypothetical protein
MQLPPPQDIENMLGLFGDAQSVASLTSAQWRRKLV